MGTPRPRKRKKREDWELNHRMIERAYLTLFKDRLGQGDLTAPSTSEISEITGITQKTIREHLEELDLDRLTRHNPLKLMANQVLGGIATAGMKGDPKCAQLFLNSCLKLLHQ